eukprot:m.1391080 g.1391080  ORF g.1391080 m.1391080 type:complete len:105 (-) comp24990_c2_seq15:729-1043(-)
MLCSNACVQVTSFIGTFVGCVSICNYASPKCLCTIQLDLIHTIDGVPPVCDFRFILIGCIEYSWNVFPATPVSSGLLQACHGIILIALWQASVGAAAASARKTK